MSDVGRIDEFLTGFKPRSSLSGHKRGISQIAWSPNGRMLGSSADDYIGIWNTETGALYRKLKEGYVYSLTWSPDGKLLASGGIFCIHVWKAEDGKGYYKLIPPTPSPIFCVAWSPDGGILASGSESKSENLQLWDVKTRQLLSFFRLSKDILVMFLVWHGRQMGGSSLRVPVTVPFGFGIPERNGRLASLKVTLMQLVASLFLLMVVLLPRNLWMELFNSGFPIHWKG